MNTEERLKELVTRLQVAHAENLVAVVLHGAAVTLRERAKAIDFQLLIVTRTLSAQDLRDARPVAKWWAAAGFKLPVYFTEEEFLDSLDVFAIEFRQMKRAYRILYGRDVLAGAEVSKANLRVQTEYELRGKLLRLRALYLPASEAVDSLTELMTDSVISFVRYLRPLLDLKGEEVPSDRLRVVQRVGELLGLDLSALERILRLRAEPVELMEVEAQDLFKQYVERLIQIIEAVDNL